MASMPISRDRCANASPLLLSRLAAVFPFAVFLDDGVGDQWKFVFLLPVVGDDLARARHLVRAVGFARDAFEFDAARAEEGVGFLPQILFHRRAQQRAEGLFVASDFGLQVFLDHFGGIAADGRGGCAAAGRENECADREKRKLLEHGSCLTLKNIRFYAGITCL
jgi:hypothetical protein